MAESTETAKAAAASGGSRALPALLGLNSLLLVGVLAVLVLRPAAGADRPPRTAAANAAQGALPGPTLRLADFVVHLRNEDTDRYARLSFEIEVAGEEEKARLATQMPQIRDAFLAYLSDRYVEDLRGSDAIAKAKAVLGSKLAEIAPGVQVRALYITDLVIQ